MLNTTNKKDKFAIKIITMSGENYEILVTENQKISELRQQVINTLQLELPSKCFIFAGLALDLHKILKDYNIRAKERIYLITLDFLKKRNITVDIKTFDGQCYPIVVTKADPLSVIAEALSNKGFNPNYNLDLNLLNNNEILINRSSFFYSNGYAWQNDSTVYDTLLYGDNTIMLVNPNFFGKLAIDTRINKGKAYTKYIFALNYLGIQLIANRYNQKYFNGTDRTIIITKSFKDCLYEMQKFMVDPNINIVGLTYPKLGENYINGHHCLLILEKVNGKVNIYDADSIVPCSYNLIIASDFYKNYKDKIEILCQLYPRQASHISCKTEALVFIKNTLLLDNVHTHVKITSEEKLKKLNKTFPPECKGFLYTEPLLKTVQMTTTIEGCGIDPKSQTILPNTGGQGKSKFLTFSEFQAKHNTEELCRPINLKSKTDINKKIKPELIKELGYLSQKTKDHNKQTAKQMVIQTAAQDVMQASFKEKNLYLI